MLSRIFLGALFFWAAVFPAVCAVLGGADHPQVPAQTRETTAEPSHAGCHGHGEPGSVPGDAGDDQEDACCYLVADFSATRTTSAERRPFSPVSTPVMLRARVELVALGSLDSPAPVPKLLNSPFVRENPPLLL